MGAESGIWGGGSYPMDELLSAADEFGVMILEDLAFAQGGHGATDWRGRVAADQERELRHQIRRQSHFPSTHLSTHAVKPADLTEKKTHRNLARAA